MFFGIGVAGRFASATHSRKQQQKGDAHEHAGEVMKNDVTIVTLAAVQQDEDAMRNAPSEMKEDKEFALLAMKANGQALQHLGEEMKGDVDVVRAAVQQDGCALEHAGEVMKKDVTIVRAAVQQDWYAFAYASDNLKHDEEIVLAAIETYVCEQGIGWRGTLWSWLTEEMRQNERVCKAAGR